jgi:ribonuclease HI
MKILESFQHGALYRIGGAFKTTSRAALEVCLHVPPPQLAIKRATEDACLQILTSPFYQTLREIREAQLSRQRILDKDPALSPLQRLERRLAQDLGQDPDQPLQIEIIEPVVVAPRWVRPNTQIASTKEEVLQQHAQLSTSHLKVYTDGSGYAGGIGAAAVLKNTLLDIDLHRQIGRDTTHTVYAAELAGINMALEVIERRPYVPTEVTTLTDNQAAVQACAEPDRRQSGQYIVRDIVRQLDHLRARGYKV